MKSYFIKLFLIRKKVNLMKISLLISINIIWVLLFSSIMNAEVIYVSSQEEFDNAHDNAAMNDSIVWRSGIYSDIYLNIIKDHLFITADTLGGTIFTGASRVNITGDYITLNGFQFLNGNIGTKDVINTTGSYNKFTQINIRAYTCYKYLRVREKSQYVEITYCNFENRLNLDDQNILSILVHETNPGYHKIQYCSFKNFDGTGNDLGIEPIRIGLSTQANRISRTLVEHCYFTQCDGDGELISNKARQNVFRFNTFENNPKAELVLRHGSESIVYGNFFLKGMGGVRVREGQNHFIYNNYFYDLDKRAIYLQNEDSDPLDNINIAFNTIVNCSEIILGGDGNYKPTNVTFANNILSDPKDRLFEESTGTETWIGNVGFGNLGINLPTNGMTLLDPKLVENNVGCFGLTQGSPAINAALPGYPFLPQFEGMVNVDTEILFDLMKQNRPSTINQKDLGCNEYPHNILIQPTVTENNTGPSYNTSETINVQNTNIFVKDLIKINPNPVFNQLNITVYSKNNANLNINIYNFEGRKIDSIQCTTNFKGEISISKNVNDLPPGFYTIRANSLDRNSGVQRMQSIKFIKSK